METLYVFLDESGDLGERGTGFFNLTALCTFDVKPIEKIVKKARARRLSKKLKELPELKANWSDDALRRRILEKLSRAPCAFRSLVVDKARLPAAWSEDNERLYNHLAGLLMRDVDMLGVNRVQLIYDKRHTHRARQDEFERYVRKQMAARFPNVRLNIQGLASFQHAGLTAVDFAAWAVHRLYNANDDRFVKPIEAKLRIIHFESSAEDEKSDGP